MAIIEDDVDSVSPGGIRWLRVVAVAFLLEVVLFAVLVPIGIVSGAIAAGNTGGTGNEMVFLIAVPIGCLVFGYLAGRIVVRGVSAHRVAHGLLTGVIATGLYLVLCMLGTGGLRAAIAVYGPALFWANNLLRILGTTGGAAYPRRG
jgi:hypothetical protein